MKKITKTILLLCLSLLVVFAGCTPEESKTNSNKEDKVVWNVNEDNDGILKILTLGNSFSVDTMEYVASIAKSVGIERIKLGNLMTGGCSINQHYAITTQNRSYAEYYENDGSGWIKTYGVLANEVLASEQWDYVTIQPGTGDHSYHTREVSYKKLVPLIEHIKTIVPSTTKIAYNLTWVGEPYGSHFEMIEYEGDQRRLFSDILDMVNKVVLPLEEVDFIIPTGLAVQNLRTATKEVLTRDTYHLSFSIGRYLAGLTFFSKVTGMSLNDVVWTPEEVDGVFRELAKQAASAAIEDPSKITELKK